MTSEMKLSAPRPQIPIAFTGAPFHLVSSVACRWGGDRQSVLHPTRAGLARGLSNMDEFDAFWQATTAQLKTHLRQLNTESSSVWDTVQAFVHAVDWRVRRGVVSARRTRVW